MVEKESGKRTAEGAGSFELFECLRSNPLKVYWSRDIDED